MLPHVRQFISQVRNASAKRIKRPFQSDRMGTWTRIWSISIEPINSNECIMIEHPMPAMLWWRQMMIETIISFPRRLQWNWEDVLDIIDFGLSTCDIRTVASFSDSTNVLESCRTVHLALIGVRPQNNWKTDTQYCEIFSHNHSFGNK